MEDSKTEISLPMALLLALAVCLLWLYFANPNLCKGILYSLNVAHVYNKGFLYFSVPLFASNMLWLGAILARRYGILGQGSRLRAMNRAVSFESLKSKLSFSGLIYGSIVGSLLLMMSQSFLPPRFLGNHFSLWLTLAIQPGLFSMLAVGRVRQLIRYFRKPKVSDFSLDPFPIVENGIVLGSINDEDLSKKPEWLILDLKALAGSVLITGSVGSGKTAGTILPYFRQVLMNFEPRPSILVLDPKRTFIATAKKVIAELKISTPVRVLSLSGEETYNPVYMPNILRNANFIHVADMVRAAAINFLGKSGDSPFWEISSFNLIKNTIIYCAATKGYFTLLDLYGSMIEASKTPLGDELTELLSKKTVSFNDEEAFNIRCAVQYFDKEYRELDDRVRSGILATATAFLNQFQEYRSAQIFCPPKDKLTIKSMDELIDNGEILLFDIDKDSLAKSMGTLLKLQYEKSILDRVATPGRNAERPAVMFCDEYQDVVTCGGGNALGDERFFAKCREANGISFVATQSLTSLMASIGNEKSARELIQNLKTRISCQSADMETISSMRELVGKEDIERTSHTFSEMSQSPTRNLIVGGFDSPNANLTESVSISKQQEYQLSGKEFSKLTIFEAHAMIFDGIRDTYQRLYLKPYFLNDKAKRHCDVIKHIESGRPAPVIKGVVNATLALIFMLAPKLAFGFPTICEVVKQPQFQACLEWRVTPATCGWPPHPCARISYDIPQSFLETTVGSGLSHFNTYPGAASQLAAIPKTPFGTVDDEELQAMHARSIAIPFASLYLSMLPCGGERSAKLCFDGMSEHFGEHWNTGSGDLLQPEFLAWQASIKACLIKGALGAVSTLSAGDSAMCSIPLTPGLKFPPSQLPVCTPWGVMFPRYGTVDGPSEVIGSLAIAERIKSLSVEVLHSMPATPGEKWQMISPNSSMCFREYEHIPMLEGPKLVNNRNRAVGKDLQGNLFATWKKVTCLKEWGEVPYYTAQIAILQSACQGVQ